MGSYSFFFWGGGVILDGYRVFVGDDENVLGIDSGDGYKIL